MIYELYNYITWLCDLIYASIFIFIYLHVLYELLKWHHNAFHMHWGILEREELVHGISLENTVQRIV